MRRLSASPATKKKGQRFPPGWNEKRVKAVIDYYDRQTEDEEAAEYEAAMKLQDQTMMFVQRKLVPEIQKLIARRDAGRSS